jgi:hypothetical protein
VAQYLDYDGSALVNSDYTIFVVEKNGGPADTSPRYFLGGEYALPNGNLHLGYRNNTNYSITQAHFGNDLNYTRTPALHITAPAMHSFWFSTSGGKKYWNNGGVDADAFNSQTAALVSYNEAKIALYLGSDYYKGDIAEIIMFSRALSDKDRQAVESYLSKKWAIKIS